MKKPWSVVVGVLVGLLVAGLAWFGLAFVSYFVFHQVFAPSGHPPMPGAPGWLYLTVFLVACPLISIGVGVWLGRLLARRLS